MGHTVKVPLQFPAQREVSFRLPYLQVKCEHRDKEHVELSRPFLPSEVEASASATSSIKPMQRLPERFKDACVAKRMLLQEKEAGANHDAKKRKRDPVLKRVAHFM